jgi:UDP-N-acetylglucosamine 2-epimerase
VAGALEEIGEPIVFPAHPRTQAALAETGVSLPGNVRVLPPAGYLDFAALASQARTVLTDSGGIQKEAYWYRVPCVTLRTTSEWVETLETGWNRLVGTDPEAIVAAVREAAPQDAHPPLYGDGHAAERIVDLLCSLPGR